MTEFAYVARTRDGATERGSVDAVSEQAALQRLRGQGLAALELRARSDERSGARRGIAILRPRRVDVELEMRQLAFLLKSGVPLLQSLRTCAAQSSRASMAAVWLRLAERVQLGTSLSDAMQRERVFPGMVRSLVAVGEQTGSLDHVLTRAADALERQRERTTAVVTSLTYPAIVMLLATATIGYMVVALIPKLSEFLRSMNKSLPAPTRLLIAISDFVRANATWLAVGALVATVLALVVWFGPLRRRVLDPLLLRVPVVGRVIRLAASGTFSHNLALLLSSGVRLTTALETVRPLLPNGHLERVVARARDRVLEGARLCDSLGGDRRSFGPVMISTIAVGESSGNLDEVLDHAGEFHDAQLQSLVKRLGALVEPALVVVVGGIVGFVYIAFFMAIYAAAGRSS